MMLFLFGGGAYRMPETVEEAVPVPIAEFAAVKGEQEDSEENWRYLVSRDPSNFHLSQGGGNDCGPTSLAMVINYFLGMALYDTTDTSTMLNVTLGRLPFDASSLFPQWGNNKGASMPWGMVMASNAYGSFLRVVTKGDYTYTATGKNHSTMEDLANALHETGNPVIVLFQYSYGLHWFIVVGCDQDTVWVMDPSKDTDIIIYDRSYFEPHFTDPVTIGGITFYDGYMIKYTRNSTAN